MVFVTGRKAYLHNLFTSYLPYFSQIGITIIITPLLINTFGQEKYGVFIIINTLIGYFTLSNIGLPQTITRLLIEKKQKTTEDAIDQIINSTLFYYLLIIGIVFIINVTIFYFNHFGINNLILSTDNSDLINSFAIGMVIVSIVFGTKLLSELFDAIIKATNKIYITNIIKFVNVMLLGFSTYLSLIFFGTIESVLLANAFVSMLVFLILYIRAKKIFNFSIDYRKSSFKVFKDMIPSSFWYFMSGIAILIILQTDNLVVSSIIGLSSVAIYSLMFKFSDIFRQIISNIVNVLFSDISKLYVEREYDLILKKHDTILFIIIGIVVITSLFLYFIGYQVFQYWIGVENAGTIDLFFYFIVYMALFSINQVSGLFLGAINKHRNAVLMGLLQAILNLITSIFFLYFFQDVKWVIISTIIALVFTNFWYNPYSFYKNLALIKNDKIQKN